MLTESDVLGVPDGAHKGGGGGMRKTSFQGSGQKPVLDVSRKLVPMEDLPPLVAPPYRHYGQKSF